MADKVLIYGGSGGVGAALARQLVRSGRSVHLVARRDEPLRALADELSATFTLGDVLDPSTFARATADAGSISGLVYAVGSIRLAPLARLTQADFSADFQLNALGAALAVQAAVNSLKQGTGDRAILLFSSVAASQGFAFHAATGMAKAAVNGLVLALAAELAPRIRVNAIAPSLLRTPLAAPLLNRSSTSVDSIAALHALPRIGEAEDVAQLGSLLLAPESAWITGQVMAVDGGRSTLRIRG